MTEDAETSPRQCRKCSGSAVRVVQTTEHRLNSFYIGRSFEHRCPDCGATFKTGNTLRIVLGLGTQLLLIPMFAWLAWMTRGDEEWWWMPLGIALTLVCSLWAIGFARLAINGWLNPRTG